MKAEAKGRSSFEAQKIKKFFLSKKAATDGIALWPITSSARSPSKRANEDVTSSQMKYAGYFYVMRYSELAFVLPLPNS